MSEGGYPYPDIARALEQMGWLKAQIEACSTKEDLVRLESKLREERRAEHRALVLDIRKELDDAFRHAVPGTETLVKRIIREDRDEEDARMQKVLAAKGLEIGEDGQIRSKVNPVKSFFVRNWFVLLGLAAAIAIAEPEWFAYVWQPVLRIIF